MVSKILVVDDDPGQVALVRRVLEPSLGHLVDAAVDGTTFARRLVERDFSLVITELELGWGEGVGVLEAVKAVDPHLPIVLLTHVTDLERVGAAVGLGLSALVPKTPAGYGSLPSVVGDLIGTTESGSAGAPAMLRVADSLPVGMFTLDREGRIEEGSFGLARTLGAPSARDLRGRALTDFLVDSRDRVRWQTMVAAKRATRDWEVAIRGDDGEERWVRIVAQWTVEDGGPHCRGAVEDISDYKRAEESLARHAEALERSNAELMDYARVVSHDLQEPLQLITRYAKLLGELEASDAKDSRRYLEHVVASAGRMQEMIDGILEYSRVERDSGEPGPVELATAAEQAVRNLTALVDAAGATVEIEALPTVHGHFHQLVSLFQNLIGNAVKFRGERAPTVRVRGEERAEEWVVTVADDGIGIETADQRRIFAMGERLAPSRYPGSGIGLAVCKRIVEHHGGVIEVDSTPGEGTTFELRFPKRPAAETTGRERAGGEDSS